MTERFAICVDPGPCEGVGLDQWKVYAVLEDPGASRDGEA
jgi:hypothetical protein